MPRSFMPIAAAFAPNYTLRDVLIAAGQLLPWKWKELQSGPNAARFEQAFCDYMDVEQAVSFDSGRAGFYAILRALEIGAGDEVILQAFTTVALPNTIRLLGARPVFVDIAAGTYNLDPERIEEGITSRTKAIVIQHTFGNPADVRRVTRIAEKHRLKVIEDCAHALGAEHAGRKTGEFSDAAFFSFGRDKVISSVTGGMVIARDSKLANRIEEIRDGLEYPEKKTVVRHLLHPLITFTALHTYELFGLGKAIMFLALRLGILDKAYSRDEKKGEPQTDFARRMPNALARIARHQLKLTDKFNRRRREVARKYEDLIRNDHVGLPQTLPQDRNIFLWYTITVPDKHALIKKAQKQDIILGDWFPQAIGPREVDLEKSGYRQGSCPVAEKVSAHCVNLPTHHNMHQREVSRVADCVNRYA